jgi:hypothetical protein
MQTTQKSMIVQTAVVAALVIVSMQQSAAQSPAYSIIYNFKGGNDGSQPKGTLVRNQNGVLFGPTYGGGTGA